MNKQEQYNKTNKRNKRIQLIKMDDGSVKKIMHEKKFNTPQYADQKSIWNTINKAPKMNSKKTK